MMLCFTGWTIWAKYVRTSINNIVNYEGVDCYVLKSGLLSIDLPKANQEDFSIIRRF